MQVVQFSNKLLITILVVGIVAVLYNKFADLISKDFMILLCMIFQYLISGAMIVIGKTVGGSSGQAATIMLFGITPFEIVKFIYIFIIAGLLCKYEVDKIKIFSLNIDREWLLIAHTVILSIFFIICNELGTLMIIYMSCLTMLFIYGKKRKFIISAVAISIIGYIIVLFVCNCILYPMIASEKLNLPQVMIKLIKRFGTVFNPENVMHSDGYQATLGLEAISIGGLLGISTERYRLPLPEAENDFVFANVIQTCGLLMGIIMILFFFALLKRGIEIAGKCEDTYFQGIAMVITILITVETVIHIGYNTAVAPITGIPLYFVSQGFTAIITGMALIAILLIVSTDKLYRTVK